ncbi:MAG: hypothetical protein HY719_03875, partial [Planctomycetes bacterium]|nr:hypothetical protein [Planctomycetota bacterium]
MTAPATHHQTAADEALARLYSDARDGAGGFWDGGAGRLIGRYRRLGEREWAPDFATEHPRDLFGPFALWNVALLARDLPLPEPTRLLAAMQLDVLAVAPPPATGEGGVWYGLFPALALGGVLFDRPRAVEAAGALLSRWREFPGALVDLHHCPVLIGLAALAGADPAARALLARETERLLAAQDSAGRFRLPDWRHAHHQRWMYAIWALAEAARALGWQERARPAIARALAGVTSPARMEADGAFQWHPGWWWVRRGPLRLPMRLSRNNDLFFECHQTFFVNAVAAYRAVGGGPEFDAA